MFRRAAREPDPPPAPQAASRGFGNLRCPLCGETATIAVDLDDLARFRCDSCEDEFGIPDVNRLIVAADRWDDVLAWIESGPAR